MAVADSMFFCKTISMNMRFCHMGLRVLLFSRQRRRHIRPLPDLEQHGHVATCHINVQNHNTLNVVERKIRRFLLRESFSTFEGRHLLASSAWANPLSLQRCECSIGSITINHTLLFKSPFQLTLRCRR